MRNILILLSLSYVCSDKLDLTYLPPPGSQYAGGRPGDIQTPLEFPKQPYSTTRRPPGLEFNQNAVNPADYEATIGINRIPPRPNNRPEIPGSNVPFTSNQNTFGVPTTTVSYAFTQTTTHPPSESFETTINPVTGLPIFNNFNTASQEPGIQENISTQYYPSTPGSTSTNNFYGGAQKLPGQQDINRNGYKPSFSTTPATPTKFPGGAFPSSPGGQTYVDRTTPGQSLVQYNQQTNSDRDSSIPFGPNQYNLNNTSVGSLINRPGFVSSTTTPYSPIPGVTYEDNININQGYPTTGSGISYGPSTQLSNEYQSISGQKSPNVPNQNQFLQNFNQNRYSDQSQIPNQQYSGEYVDDKVPSELPTSSKPRLPFSPGSFTTPSLEKQQPGFKEYDTRPSTPNYTGSNNFGNIGTTIYRPQRPQAEADRNAVILNYENVLTPEGFAYTFDTSNGIHADESGTAVDGVKAKGSFSYTGDDGNVYSIVYTADENGFQPHGDHLPTPPPIPEAIQRIIEKVKQEKEAGIFDDGTYDEGKYGYKKYQGDKGFYPQVSAINNDGIDFQKENQYNVPSRTQIGFRRPSSEGSKVINDKKVQPSNPNDYEHQISSNDERRPSEYTNIRPVNRLTSKDGQSITGNLQDIPNKPSISRIPSRRPSVEIEKSQYEEDDSRRRPSAQYSDQENVRQYIEDTGFDSDAERKGLEIKGSSRRPVSKYNDIRTENTKGLRKQPVQYIEKQKQGTFDNYPGSEVSSKHPSIPSYVYADEYDIENENNRKGLPNSKTSTKYPSKIENGDNGATSHSPSGPRTLKPSNKVSTFDQTITKTRRPNRPGLRVNDNEEYADYIDNTHQVEDDNQNNDNLGTTPYYGAFEDDGKETSDIPQIYSTKYAATQDDYQNPDTTEEYDENSQNQYSVRLSPKPRTGIEETIKENVNKTGYQYIPPHTKFDELNNLPGRVSTTRRPSQQTYYTKASTGRPFVTPGGTQVTYKTPEGEYFERDSTITNNPKYPSQNQYQDRPSVNTNTGRRPDQVYSNEVVSTSQPSTTSSGPSYSSTYQTTGRPEYSNQYSQTPGFENKFEATLKPSQPGESSYYEKFGTRRPYDGVSSTTPTPSRRPTFYDSTQTTIAPGQPNIYYSEGTRKPGVFSSSTIPTSTRGPAVDGISIPDGNIATQYSTYRTMEPVNPTNDYRAEITASRLPTAGPTKGPNTVGNLKYGSRLPSTTYRPNYTIVAKGDSPTAGPGIVVDRYGRPLPTLESQGYNQQYPGEQINVSVDNKPGRPQYGPKGELLTPTGYQTSTQRIIGEDFSGPKQQQKFDPKTGYYY